MKPWLRLVRAPAALTVLGDTAVGAAAAGLPMRGRRLLLPLASASSYWAGMALNDWSDRELDAVERPERPIPAGEISARAALIAGTGLGLTGLAIAVTGGGRRTLLPGALLGAAIWTYDTRLKPGPAGPAAMAACRVLDVLVGAGPGWRAALPDALTIGLHTFGVTALSRGEVHGGSPAVAAGAVAATSVSTLALVQDRPSRLATLLGLGYLSMVAGGQRAVVRSPSAERVRRATVAGIHGTVLLQAALCANRGARRSAAACAASLPIARLLSRRNSPT